MAAIPLQDKISQTSSFNASYRKREYRLGDGFSMRVPDGLNAKTWKGNIVFTPLSTAELNTLTAFLDGIGSWGTFDYQPPGAVSTVKFAVDEAGPSITPMAGNVYQVTLSCRQEYDLS